MPKRLSKIYTRTGDLGETSLANGTRVHKSSSRIEALGCLDELNSWIGLVLTQLHQPELEQTFQKLQHQLFDLGGEIAIADPEYQTIDQQDITHLEDYLDRLNAQLPALAEFILPAGSSIICHIHLARTVCRRAERVLCTLQDTDSETVNPSAVTFLNRLSDFLFVAARFLTKELDEQETLWKPKTQRP